MNKENKEEKEKKHTANVGRVVENDSMEWRKMIRSYMEGEVYIIIGCRICVKGKKRL